MITTLLSSYLVTYVPVVIQYMIDTILNTNGNNAMLDAIARLCSSTSGFLITMCICLFLIQIGIQGINLLKGFSKNKVIQQIEYELKTKLVEFIQELTYQDFTNTSFADLIQKSNRDIDNIIQFIDKQFTFFLELFLVIIFAMMQLARLDIRLASIILVSACCIIGISISYYKKSKPHVQQKIEIQKEMFSKLEDNYTNQKFVRVNNLEEKEKEKFNNILDSYYQKNEQVVKIDARYGKYIQTVIRLQPPLIFILGGFLCYLGQITLGSIYVVLQYSSKISEAFKEVNEIIALFNAFMESYRRINDLLQSNTEKEEGKIVELPNLDIVFEDVSITMSNQVILEHLNFTIKENQKVLLLGATGSGKTILCQTLVGFYPYTGSITIGGMELREISKKIVRQKICMLLQDSYVFSRTIEENLKILNQDLKQEDMVELVKDVRLYEDINLLEEKFKTPIGVRGITLSKGQRQRLVLARAFAKPKPIFIYDDAFSAIDNVNKKQIVQKILHPKEQNTTIMITYDMDFVEEFDQIIYLKDKKIMVGTHDELLQDENYQRIYELSKDKLGASYE